MSTPQNDEKQAVDVIVNSNIPVDEARARISEIILFDFNMRTTIFSTSLFLITSLCLFAQIGSSDERKIDDMGRKLEALKASLMEMQKDSDSPRIINPPAPPKRVFEKSEIENSAPKTNNSSINRVFDQVSPSIITESISPEKVDQGFENLNERFSSISKQINDEDANYHQPILP